MRELIEHLTNTLAQNRARLRQSEASVANARTSINRAQVALDKAEKDYTRQKALFGEGAISQAAWEQALITRYRGRQRPGAVIEPERIIRSAWVAQKLVERRPGVEPEAGAYLEEFRGRELDGVHLNEASRELTGQVRRVRDRSARHRRAEGDSSANDTGAVIAQALRPPCSPA